MAARLRTPQLVPLLAIALTACTSSKDSTELGDYTRKSLEKCFAGSSSPAAPRCAEEILPQIPPGTKGDALAVSMSRDCWDIIASCNN